MHVANAIAGFEKRHLAGYETALRYLALALEEHPDHPRILSLKAMVHADRGMVGRHPRTELETAESLIEKAKAHGYTWECSLVEAWIRACLYFDWAGAEVLFDRAIEASHGEAKYHPLYAAFLVSQLRAEEAIRILEAAVMHFSHDVVATRSDLVISQIIAGRLDDAEVTLRSALELFPRAHYLLYIHLATLHEARGNYKEAARAIQEVPITALESTLAIGLRYLFIGLSGDREEAEHGYERLRLLKQSGAGFVPASQLAVAALGADDPDAAVAWLEAAAVERDPIINWIAVLPFFRHLYYHARFRSLITETLRLKLSPLFLR
jgi:Tfp pilus assembly protein PilF